MKNQNKRCRRDHWGGLTFGLVLIVVGALFLGRNAGWISPELRSVLFTWQALLVLIGAVNLCRRRFTSGTILIAIGVFFILPNIARIYPEVFGDLPVDTVRAYWPALLILAGALILFRSFSGTRPTGGKRFGSDWRGDPATGGSKQTLPPTFDYHAVFSGGEYIVLDPVFTGGKLNALFGGITLDLRKTTLPEGETQLEIQALFGGVTLCIPSDWTVELHVDCFAGGVSDERSEIAPYDPRQKLIVKGSCVFGGAEIRN